VKVDLRGKPVAKPDEPVDELREFLPDIQVDFGILRGLTTVKVTPSTTVWERIFLASFII
jgi:hypothetical protein